MVINMAYLPLGNDNDLDDTQFCNGVEEISFLSEISELTKTILKLNINHVIIS